MRTAFHLAGFAVLTAAATVPAQSQQRDWTRTVAATPQGGYLLGNPAAATKIVEYASYTCPHCAHFATESKAALQPLLRSGSTSIEYRQLVRDPLDLAAVIVARCGGPARFARISDAIFAGQQTWLGRGADFARTNRETLSKAEPGAQLRGLAEGAGLLAIGRAQGLTDADLQRCFADKAAIDRALLSTRAVPSEVKGTPAFFVNGRYTGAHDWAGLRPHLAVR